MMKEITVEHTDHHQGYSMWLCLPKCNSPLSAFGRRPKCLRTCYTSNPDVLRKRPGAASFRLCPPHLSLVSTKPSIEVFCLFGQPYQPITEVHW